MYTFSIKDQIYMSKADPCYVQQPVMKCNVLVTFSIFWENWTGSSEEYSSAQALHMELGIASFTVVVCGLIFQSLWQKDK